MIPVLTDPGTSFNGAAAYYLHDRRQPGETERTTSERVAWTATRNLPTDDPERAWRMMAHTALSQAALKAAAGVPATGRRLKKPVIAYSLSWHPDERPTPEQQRQAAVETLNLLGLADHQALIIAHKDTRHQHVHLLVNRVNPFTGKAATLSRSRLILSRWAESYERTHGRIFCAVRVENNGRRNQSRPGRAADNRSRRIGRAEWLAAQSNRAETAAVRASHAIEFAELNAAHRLKTRQRTRDFAELQRVGRLQRNAIRDRRNAAQQRLKHPEHAATAARLARALAEGDARTALEGLTELRSTFTRGQFERFVACHTETDEAFVNALAMLEASPELIRLDNGGKGDRLTSKAQQSLERRLERHAFSLQHMKAGQGDCHPKWSGQALSADQIEALRHILAPPRIAAVIGFAGSGKSTMLAAARQSWESAGLRVIGAALSGIAADGLQQGAGIDSRTIHSRLFQWEQGRNLLTARDVLVIDEAGMIGSRQMERLLHFVKAAGAKIVLVGDPEQLQSIEAGAAFRAIVERIGAARMQSVRRQKQAWQQEATQYLATGRTVEALKRYEDAGMLHGHENQDSARAALIDAWQAARAGRPGLNQIILAFTREEVGILNRLARDRLRQAGELGPDVTIATGVGKRSFAVGDRMYFLKNNTPLGVRNGSLGTIERIDGRTMTVRLDSPEGRVVTFSLDYYDQIDHGYAATIHKSQGITVDRAHLLVTSNLDRHAAYVAMTRHRDRIDVHWSAETIGARAQLDRILSRKAVKDTSLDYPGPAGFNTAARQQAEAELRARIVKRADMFAAREATPTGRMANARSLAGSGASLREIVRLAMNDRLRALRFRQRQAKLRLWVSRLAAASVVARLSVAAPAVERGAAMKAHGWAMIAQLNEIKHRHVSEQREEAQERRALQRRVAKTWRVTGLSAAFATDFAAAVSVPAGDHGRNSSPDTAIAAFGPWAPKPA
jgi:Ti-type conjugative transfer relaxase TraA